MHHKTILENLPSFIFFNAQFIIFVQRHGDPGGNIQIFTPLAGALGGAPYVTIYQGLVLGKCGDSIKLKALNSKTFENQK